MSKVTITKEIEVPVGALIAVADILIENEMPHCIIATDEENDSVTMEVSYEKEQRDIMHEIDDAISEYEEEDGDDDDDDD